MSQTTITAYPDSYDSTNYAYAAVDSSYPLSNAVGNSSSSTTYAQWTMKTGSGAESYVYYLFDLSEIPTSVTIDSVECSAKGYISTTSSWYINSHSMQMYSGSNAKGSSVSLSTSASSQSITCGTWTRDELNDCRIRIYAKRGSFSTSTSRTMRFYGATLTVTYTYEDVQYTITSSASSGGTINPSGTMTVSPGDSLTFTLTPDQGYEFKSLTVNDVEVETTSRTSIENGVGLLHFDSDTSDSLFNCSVSNYIGTPSISTSTSKFGGASLYFDQNSALEISVGDSNVYTIEFWFYPMGSNTSGWYPTIFSTSTANGSGGTYVHIDDGSYSTYPVYRCNDTSSGNNGTYGGTVITRNTWHHFAYCRNGSSHYYFLDGNLEATVSQSSPNEISEIYLGVLKRPSSYDSATFYQGYVDELLITSDCKYTSSFSVPTESYLFDSNIILYMLEDIQSDANIYATFVLSGGSNPQLYIKRNGSYVTIGAAYKKISGTWIKQTDLSSVFDSNTNYVKG